MRLKIFREKILQSRFFRDSFYAVLGHGLGQALLLLAGIVIARFLGKDLYGEYGVAKTNMFYMAGFATFGLGISATKFVAQYLQGNKNEIVGIVKKTSCIALTFSVILAIIMIVFSSNLAIFLDTPSLIPVFRYLSLIIVFRAVSTTGIGILSGLGRFDYIARNSVLSGIIMLACCVPLTYFCSIQGALSSLAISQFANATLNYLSIRKECERFDCSENTLTTWSILKFTFPVAMQELSFTLCNWGAIALLTIKSSLGEVGIYSATAQWNAVILFLPSVLANVVLSHLSSISDKESNKKVLKKVLLIYFICTIIPFVVVFILAPFITGLYSADFIGMANVLQMMVFATIPLCCADVFKSELIALGKPWHLFLIRLTRDLVLLIALYILLLQYNGVRGAFYFALSNVLSAVVYFVGSWIMYIYIRNNNLYEKIS